jgi:hypothetical protein
MDRLKMMCDRTLRLHQRVQCPRWIRPTLRLTRARISNRRAGTLRSTEECRCCAIIQSSYCLLLSTLCLGVLKSCLYMKQKFSYKHQAKVQLTVVCLSWSSKRGVMRRQQARMLPPRHPGHRKLGKSSS